MTDAELTQADDDVKVLAVAAYTIAEAIAEYEQMAARARQQPALVWVDRYGQEHHA